MVNTLILLYGKRFTSFLNVKLVDINTGTGKHDWENECCISGEPFQQEELEEMLSAAVDRSKTKKAFSRTSSGDGLYLKWI